MVKILFLVFLSFILLGCQKGTKYDLIEVIEIGAYFFGAKREYVFIYPFEFEGDYIRIPYFFEGASKNTNADVGWLLFVNGLPLKTRLVCTNNEWEREKSYLHNFSASYQERFTFFAYFKPSINFYDTSIPVVAILIFQPDFIPSVENPIFGIFHEISQTITKEIKIQHVIQHYKDYLHFNLNNEYLEYFSDFILTPAIDNVRIGILPNHIKYPILYEHKVYDYLGFLDLSIFAVGMKNGTYRLSFFINHLPVQMNGYDFIELKVLSDNVIFKKELTFNLNEIDELTKKNVIYIVKSDVNSIGIRDSIVKSPSLLLINTLYGSD